MKMHTEVTLLYTRNGSTPWFYRDMNELGKLYRAGARKKRKGTFTHCD